MKCILTCVLDALRLEEREFNSILLHELMKHNEVAIKCFQTELEGQMVFMEIVFMEIVLMLEAFYCNFVVFINSVACGSNECSENTS